MAKEEKKKNDIESVETEKIPEKKESFEDQENEFEKDAEKQISDFKDGDKEKIENIEKSAGLEDMVAEGVKKDLKVEETLEDLNKKADELREKIKNKEDKNLLEEILISLPEETSEEYISRVSNCIVSNYCESDENFKKIPKLLQKAYYTNYLSRAETEFFDNQNNTSKFKESIDRVLSNDDNKQSKSKSNDTLNKLEKHIWGSNKESADGPTDDKVEYYTNTNQAREFFSHGKKRDAYSYSSMMFALPKAFLETKEGQDYIHQMIDNKTIFLFGGGDSIKDLLTSDQYHPKKVINFDPYLQSETITKNEKGLYESLPISASDEQISKLVAEQKIPKADEVWATYSVPFYLDSANDIKKLIENMLSVLNEGGNARISPIAVQHEEKNGDTFESRKKALLEAIQDLNNKSDFNVTIFNDTLKIHKIKNNLNEETNFSEKEKIDSKILKNIRDSDVARTIRKSIAIGAVAMSMGLNNVEAENFDHNQNFTTEIKENTESETEKEFSKFYNDKYVSNIALSIKNDPEYINLIIKRDSLRSVKNNGDYRDKEKLINECELQIENKKKLLTEDDKKLALEKINTIILLIKTAKEEAIKHINSKEYLNKLVKEVGSIDKAKKEQKDRINNFEGIKYDLLSRLDIKYYNNDIPYYAYYDPMFNEIDLPYDENIKDDEKKQEFYEAIRHELLHISTYGNFMIPEKSRNLLKESFISKLDEGEDRISYFSNSTELLVRKQGLDLEMEKLGIKKYSEKFTDGHYKKLLELKEKRELSSDSEQFLDHIKPEKFSEVMNELADMDDNGKKYYHPGWDYNDAENKA